MNNETKSEIQKLKRFGIKDLFFVDKMVTPGIATIVYWIFLIFIIFISVGLLLKGIILQAIGILTLGTLFARVWIEIILVIFKINSNLQKIVDKQ